MNLDQRLSSHPTEEILEELIFSRLPDELAAQVEEHLLICWRCQDTAADIDRFVFTLRAYADQKAARHGPAVSNWRKAFAALPGIVILETSAASVLVLGVLVLGIVRPGPPSPPPPVPVSLTSMRGGTDVFSAAPEGKPLQLTIEAPGIGPEKAPFQVQIVDSTGNPIWKGPAAQTGGKLIAALPKPLVRGIYWVRLYAGNSELLQEFGLAATELKSEIHSPQRASPQ